MAAAVPLFCEACLQKDAGSLHIGFRYMQKSETFLSAHN